MRCKKHLSDVSSGVGVCSSCLRERLFSLIAAQARQQQAQAQVQAQEESRKSDPHPPPLVFPRSVSPYVSRRKSDYSWPHHHNLPDRRFYSTPQVGPSTTTATSISSSDNKHRKFSLFSNFFRSKSDKPRLDPCVRKDSSEVASSSSSSPSWFSNLISCRRKKQTKLFSHQDSIAGGRRNWRMRDRGMSPAGESEDGEGCGDCEGQSGYSSETSQGWRRTPMAPPQAMAIRRGRSGHSRNVSGLAFCLSPLVRASPSRHWNQKGAPPDMVGLSGEVRVSVKPHLSTAASFCANRSRKLTDYGRSNYNH